MAEPAITTGPGAPRRTVYPRILASRFRSQLAYPGSFALDLVAQVIGQASELMVILVVFTQVSSLGGFSSAEVLLIYGLAASAFGLPTCASSRSSRCPTTSAPGSST